MRIFTRRMRLKTVLVLVLLAVVFLLIFVTYRSRQSAGHLDVDPHARKEIEKAKRR